MGSGLLAPPPREKSHVPRNVMLQLSLVWYRASAEQGKRDGKLRKGRIFQDLTRTPEQRNVSNIAFFDTSCQQWNISRSTWKRTTETDPEANSGKWFKPLKKGGKYIKWAASTRDFSLLCSGILEISSSGSCLF